MKQFFKNIVEDYIKFPLRIMSHPVLAYAEFKEEKKAKMSVAIVMLILA